MKKLKKKSYLVFIEQCDDDTLMKRMTGTEIRAFVKKNGPDGIAIVDGQIIKSFNRKVDLTKL